MRQEEAKIHERPFAVPPSLSPSPSGSLSPANTSNALKGSGEGILPGRREHGGVGAGGERTVLKTMA